ncbi:SAM-dependent methyltransferase [Actinocorallia libanotica]|uniref:SAM-dependent methyltransferase n=1 Tax=Actinocorallia libanotica TaxID=46162 RepID=A0ABN1QES0_9ACTN
MTSAAVPGLDVSRPHPARMYDYYLGGKDNFAADRSAADEILRRYPETRVIARQNRAFMRRATAAMAASGVRQFLDLGSGLPTADNLHQVAQRVARGSTVVYVDNDPIVLNHGRALLAGDRSTSVITADLREPDEIWKLAEHTGLLDPARPIGLLMVAVLHFVPGDLAGLMRSHLDRLAPGSHLALAHGTADGLDADRTRQADSTYQKTSSGLYLRGAREIEALFDGTRLLEPGVVPTWDWRPGPAEPDPAPTGPSAFPGVLAGVGLVP